MFLTADMASDVAVLRLSWNSAKGVLFVLSISPSPSSFFRISLWFADGFFYRHFPFFKTPARAERARSLVGMRYRFWENIPHGNKGRAAYQRQQC
jgi:hypothetical protein